jgi:D-lactate dehydrogenase
MKIAFFSSRVYEQEYFDKHNKENEITYFNVPLNEKTALLAQGCEVICAFVNDKLDAKTIDQLKIGGTKLIALRCAGYNNVDLRYAHAQQIKIVRVPAYSPEAVAEHAVALILTLNRKTHKAYNRVREGNFSLEKLIGFDLYKKTVGVIGTGKIGAAFARILNGFGCRVLAYDIHSDASLVNQGVTYLPLQQLLEQSDIISLHCPLIPETYHLINKVTVMQMKRGAMLINTSRGALIETSAVIQALKSGHLGYLGIDVYEQEEKLFFEDLSATVIQDDEFMRLMTFPNVLITSHQGFLTAEALTQIAITTMDNIKAFAEGRELVNEVRVQG